MLMKTRRSSAGRAVWEMLIVVLMITSMSALWSLVLVGVIRVFFELSEHVAVLYVGGSLFSGFFLLGLWNYKKLAIYVK